MDSNRLLYETRTISDALGNYFVENPEPINLVVPRFSTFLLNKGYLLLGFEIRHCRNAEIRECDRDGWTDPSNDSRVKDLTNHRLSEF